MEKIRKNWESPCIHYDSANWRGEDGGGCQIQLTTDFSMHLNSSGELDLLSSSSGNNLSVKGLKAGLFQEPFQQQKHRGHTTGRGTMTRHYHASQRINALIAALYTSRIAPQIRPEMTFERLQLITLRCFGRKSPFTPKKFRQIT